MFPTQQAAAAAPQQPGGAQQADGAQSQQAPVICIQQQQDGTYLVYSEDQGPDAGQPAQDVDQALQLAKQALTGTPGADGDPDDNGGAPDGDADDAAEQLFQSGFKGVRGG